MTTDTTWSIGEDDVIPGGAPDCAARDTVFALQNRRFGCRGSRPGSPTGTPGTLVAGLFDDSTSYQDVTKDAAHKWIFPMAPNLWFSRVNGQALAPAGLPRRLDLEQSVLTCSGEVDTAGGRFRLDGCRFLSWHDPRLACERIVVEPLEPGRTFTVFVGLDDTVPTVRRDARFDPWRERQRTNADGAVLTWHAVTRACANGLGVAMECRCEGAAVRPAEVGGVAGFEIRGGGRLVIDRFVGLDSVVTAPDALESATAACRRAAAAGFDACMQQHRAALRTFWDVADIRIDGPVSDQRAIRFCILAIGGARPERASYSVGAKLLAGTWYWGQVFWDMDIFILPYLTRVFPDAARRHIEFRHAGLPEARRKAVACGHRGALYPWNQGPDGTESCLNVFGDEEVHISADVVWGVMDYVEWTGDRVLMDTIGWEILADVARFWTSRMDADGAVRKVCGPDERGLHSDNNAYTNYLARYTLVKAVECCRGKVPDTELAVWRTAADRLVQKQPDADGVIEQYDGYFRLPRGDKSGPAYENEGLDQILKQADVIMLPFLFPDRFPREVLAANFDFYEPRTQHESSLSPGPHAVVAARLGRRAEALRFFRDAAGRDLQARKSTDGGGLHAAACGSVLLAVMRGFAGLSQNGQELVWAPRLPEGWRSLRFSVKWRGEIRPVDVRQ